VSRFAARLPGHALEGRAPRNLENFQTAVLGSLRPALTVKNLMRVIRSSGSVRGGNGNIFAYSAEGELDLVTVGKLWVCDVAHRPAARP